MNPQCRRRTPQSSAVQSSAEQRSAHSACAHSLQTWVSFRRYGCSVPHCSFRRGSALTALHTEHPADNPNNLFLTSSAHLHERIGILDSTDMLPSAHASAWPTPRGGTPIAITAADLSRGGEQHAESGTTMPPRATTAPGDAASRSDEVRRSGVTTRSAQATTPDGCALVCVRLFVWRSGALE